MKRSRKKLIAGIGMLLGFALWTVIIQCIDVRRVGPNASQVGLACINVWFHRLTGVHMAAYTLTDWLGLVPIFVCLCFGALGIVQWIGRGSIRRVDIDILLLGVYYSIVIAEYLVFEMIPINYRPILINGIPEASYPSSTTLLVLSVLPTLTFQVQRRVRCIFVCRACAIFSAAFTLFMVAGRLYSGVHWLTDIVGAVMLSVGSFLLYLYAVERLDTKEKDRGVL